MKQEIPRHNQIDQRTMLNRRFGSEVQGGPAFKHVNFHPSQFCTFIDDDNSPNWECARCKRRIGKSRTFGNKPVVVCGLPPIEEATKADGLYPVATALPDAGHVITRMHRTAPKFGVGFELKKIFSRLDVELPPSCVCHSRAMFLNDLSLDEVDGMRDKIMTWFEEEASKRALPFDFNKASKILNIAIRRARKAGLKEIQKNAAKSNG
jgi:hypothetical protein